MRYTTCILGGEELSRYARVAASTLGLRVDCEDPAILVLLPGFDAERACRASRGAAVIVACCSAIVDAARAALAPPASRVAAPPGLVDELLGAGLVPLPQSIAVHLAFVSVAYPESLYLGLREALRLAECILGGRCTPPYTRVKWRPRCTSGRGS